MLWFPLSVLPKLSENLQYRMLRFLKIRTETKTLAEKGPVLSALFVSNLFILLITLKM